MFGPDHEACGQRRRSAPISALAGVGLQRFQGPGGPAQQGGPGLYPQDDRLQHSARAQHSTGGAAFSEQVSRSVDRGGNASLAVRSIQQLVASYRELAGLDVRATPHTLRHSHASQLVAAGVPTVHVQKVLGHRHLSSTQIYTHVSKEQLLESARALE